MRQEFMNLTGALRRQPGQNIFEVGKRIMPIEPGTLDQTHHRSSALARTQGSQRQAPAAGYLDSQGQGVHDGSHAGAGSGWAAPKTETTRASAVSVPARMSMGAVASQMASMRII